MKAGDRKAVIAALCANLGIAIAKFVGFLVTGAASMQAEAVHSLADTGNQALLLWGGATSARTATPSHPFGFGRERYFWCFIVALVLFALGAIFSIYEGVSKLQHPHPIQSPEWAIGILLVAVLLEGYSLRTAIVAARAQLKGRSWWVFIRETKQPELPVVLLEDLGALLGLVIALAGVSLAALTGNGIFDALGSISIGVLLGAIAIVLAVEMKSLLIGEAASEADREAIREALLGGDEILGLIHMRTQHLAPDQILVAAKLEFSGQLPFDSVARAIDAAELRVRQSVPAAKIIFIEPDIYVEGRTHERPAWSH